MNTYFDFLGGSQTFFGLLVTIILLFVIDYKDNKSNLVQLTLGETKKRLQDQISHLGETTSLDSSVINTQNYSKLHSFIMNEDASKLDLRNKGISLLAEITAVRTKLQADYIDVEDNNKLLDKISGCREILLSPFYTLLFTITLFIFDEILRSESLHHYHYIIQSILGHFILFSYFFWIVLWANFIFRHQITNSKGKYPTFKEKWNNLTFGKKVLICCLTFIFTFFIIYFIENINIYYPFSLLTFFATTIFICFGLFMISTIKDNEESEFSYMFICRHFLFILIVSILLTLFCFGAMTFTSFYDILPTFSNNSTVYKISSFVFIILNGIISPFIMPYVAFNRLYHYVRKKTIESKNAAEPIISSLNNKLGKFADVIDFSYTKLNNTNTLESKENNENKKVH